MRQTYPIAAIAGFVLSLCVAASAAIPGDPIVRLKLPDTATAACAGGMVNWNPPLEDLGKTVNVILSIRDDAGHEVPQAFDIHFVAPADGNGFIKANPTTTQSAASAPQPAADSIAKMDENRMRLPQGNCVYTPGMNGHMLLLVKDQLAILSSDGFTIEQKLLMPKAYLGIGERKDYYVGICDNPRTVDIIDKSSLKVIRSRVFTYPRLTQLALNPTLPISYIVYQDGATERMKHLIALDETTGKPGLFSNAKSQRKTP